MEQPSFLGSLLTTKTWTIQRGFYCCYDVITRTDVRCELCIPGGVVAGAVDATGMVAEVGPANWRNIQVREAALGHLGLVSSTHVGLHLAGVELRLRMSCVRGRGREHGSQLSMMPIPVANIDTAGLVPAGSSGRIACVMQSTALHRPTQPHSSQWSACVNNQQHHAPT